MQQIIHVNRYTGQLEKQYGGVILPRLIVKTNCFLNWSGSSSFRTWLLLNSYIVRKASKTKVTNILYEQFYKEKGLLPAYFRVNDLANMLGKFRSNFIRDKHYLIKEGYIRTLRFQYKGKWDRDAYILGTNAGIMEKEGLYAFERCLAPGLIINTFSEDSKKLHKYFDEYLRRNHFHHSDELKKVIEYKHDCQHDCQKQSCQQYEQELKDYEMRLILPRNVLRSEQFLDWAGRPSFRVWIYLMMNLIQSNDMESETAQILYNDFYEKNGLLVAYFSTEELGRVLGLKARQIRTHIDVLVKSGFIKRDKFTYKGRSKRCFILGERGNNFDDKIYVFDTVLGE